MNDINNKQDRKLNNQVNHLQSFIGIPTWNGGNPTLSEIREYDRLLIEKQSLGFKPRRESIFYRALVELKSRVSKVIALLSQLKQRTKNVKHQHHVSPQN